MNTMDLFIKFLENSYFVTDAGMHFPNKDGPLWRNPDVKAQMDFSEPYCASTVHKMQRDINAEELQLCESCGVYKSISEFPLLNGKCYSCGSDLKFLNGE